MDSELADERQHYASARFARALRLEDEHVRALLEMRREMELYRTGQDLVRVGEPYKHTMLLEQGWAMRFKLLSDGRRQVINLYLPGDAIVSKRLRRTSPTTPSPRSPTVPWRKSSREVLSVGELPLPC